MKKMIAKKGISKSPIHNQDGHSKSMIRESTKNIPVFSSKHEIVQNSINMKHKAPDYQ